MLTYLPKPYVDELFFSIVARYASHMGGRFGRPIAEQLFGKTTVSFQADLLPTIRYFANNSFLLWNLSAEEIIRKFTLYKYYTYFADEPRVIKALEFMISGYHRGIKNMLGLAASRVAIPEYLRFCPECSSEDFERYGETYWRRVHQISGVLVCTRHKGMLCDSIARYRGGGLNYCIDASDVVQMSSKPPKGKLSGEKLDIALRIARVCEDVLVGRSNEWGQINVRTQYRESAREGGYLTKANKINQMKLGNDFANYFGVELLQMLGCELRSANNAYWLKQTVSDHMGSHHPLHNILLQIFFNHPPKLRNRHHNFGLGPWKCPNQFVEHNQEKSIRSICTQVGHDGNIIALASCNCGFRFLFEKTNPEDSSLPIVSRIIEYGPSWEREAKEIRSTGRSIRTVAKMLGVSKVIAEQLLHEKTTHTRRKEDTTKIASWRNEWKALQESVFGGSKSKARKIRPGLYRNLYLYDREWLISQPMQEQLSRKGIEYVDWRVRDKKCLHILQISVIKIREQTPVKRVLRGTIVKMAGLFGKMWGTDMKKLPLSEAFLRESQETIEEFRERQKRVWQK